MNATKNILYDKDGNEFYPKTVTSNVYDEDGNRLDNVLGGLIKNKNVSGTTNANGNLGLGVSLPSHTVINAFNGDKQVSLTVWNNEYFATGLTSGTSYTIKVIYI